MDLNKYLFVVDMNDFHGHAHTIFINGKPLWGDKTLAEFKAEGYSVLSADEFDKLVNEFEQSMCGGWKEVTEDQYNDALDVLPPYKWENGGFYIGEPYSGSVHSFYQEFHGKFYCSLQSTRTPRKEILESLKVFLERR